MSSLEQAVILCWLLHGETTELAGDSVDPALHRIGCQITQEFVAEWLDMSRVRVGQIENTFCNYAKEALKDEV